MTFSEDHGEKTRLMATLVYIDRLFDQLVSDRFNQGTHYQATIQLYRQTWQRLQARQTFYRDMPILFAFERPPLSTTAKKAMKGYSQFNQWFDKSNKLKKKIDQLEEALEALNELYRNGKNDSTLKENILKIIHIQLLSLERYQLNQLRETQDIYIDQLNEKMKQDLKAITKTVMKDKNFAQALAFSELLRRRRTPYLKEFLRHQKRQRIIHPLKHLLVQLPLIKDIAKFLRDHVKMGMAVAESVMGASFAVTSHSPHFFSSLLFHLKSAFYAIPIISSVINGLVITYYSIDTLVKTIKSPLQKVGAFIGIGVAVMGTAAAVTLGLTTTMIAAAIIAIGLAAFSTVKQEIIPWIRLRRRRIKREQEREIIDKRITELKEAKNLIVLKPYEQQLLLKELEAYWLVMTASDKRKWVQELAAVKRALFYGYTLASNPLILSLLHHKKMNQFTALLVAINQERKESLPPRIRLLHHQEREKRWQLSVSAMSIVGLTLVCIPTPPTILIGISLMAISSTVGIGSLAWLKYQWYKQRKPTVDSSEQPPHSYTAVWKKLNCSSSLKCHSAYDSQVTPSPQKQNNRVQDEPEESTSLLRPSF